MATDAFVAQTSKCRTRSVRWWSVLFCAASLGLVTDYCQAAADFRLSEGRKVRMTLYAKGSLTPAITMAADRIFTDRHHLGFFKVRVMPVVVVEGLRLGIAPSATNLDWPASIRSKLVPVARATSQIECRNLQVGWLPETQPRLEARRLLLPSSAKGTYAVLEDVTLHSGGEVVRVPHARLLLEGQPGRVAWEAQGAAFQWDLSTAQVLPVRNHQVNTTETP